MIRVTDQLHRTVELPGPAKRIVSLVPSQTELLYALGLEKEVVGITRFCIHPEHWFRNKQRVGGTKDFRNEAIRQLNPDLILANKEENTKELLEELQQVFPVYTSDIHTLEDACDMMLQIGVLTGRASLAAQLVNDCRTGFRNLRPMQPPLRVLYFIWREPWMCAGNDTFIDDMLKRCGFINACQLPRYPELNPEKLKTLLPERILLSSEPYPFREKHIAELKQLLPHCPIQLVDGEYFSWYGSRLKDAPGYFAALLQRND